VIPQRMAVLIRLFADADGESRFGTAQWVMTEQEFAPPAASFSVSDAQPAERVVMRELPVDWGGDNPQSDTSPTPTDLFFWSVQNRDQWRREPILRTGRHPFDGDVSGKGHWTWVTSAVPVRAIMIRLGSRAETYGSKL
jgi:hypothetical protein